MHSVLLITVTAVFLNQYHGIKTIEIIYQISQFIKLFFLVLVKVFILILD